MYKIINKQEDFVVKHLADKNSIFYLPNGYNGKLHPYHIIDAVTLNASHKDGCHTFALLEHEELGEDDCVIVKLPNSGKMIFMHREDRSKWGVLEKEEAIFIPAGLIVVEGSYNGLDDLEDADWDLTDAYYWSEEEINCINHVEDSEYHDQCDTCGHCNAALGSCELQDTHYCMNECKTWADVYRFCPIKNSK